MQVSEAHASQEILIICDILDVAKQEITVNSVYNRLVKETGYDYPWKVIEKVIQERDAYVWNSKTHGYEKVRGEE